MRFYKLPYVVSFTLMLVLYGCAGVTKKEVSQEAIKNINNIVIVKVHNVEEYGLHDFGNPFGVIGGSVNGLTKSDQLNEILKTNGFDFARQMESELKAELENAGYIVNIVEVKKENPGKLLENLEGVDTNNADAVIDVAVRVIGYASINLVDSEYRPYIDMLVDLKNKQGNILYGDHILYGAHNPFMDAHEIESPKQYYYETFDSLVSASDDVATGMKMGVTNIVKYIASNLSKNRQS